MPFQKRHSGVRVYAAVVTRWCLHFSAQRECQVFIKAKRWNPARRNSAASEKKKNNNNNTTCVHKVFGLRIRPTACDFQRQPVFVWSRRSDSDKQQSPHSERAVYPSFSCITGEYVVDLSEWLQKQWGVPSNSVPLGASLQNFPLVSAGHTLSSFSRLNFSPKFWSMWLLLLTDLFIYFFLPPDKLLLHIADIALIQ